MIRETTNLDKTVVGVHLSGRTLQAGRVNNNTVEKFVSKQIDIYGTEEYVIKEVITAIEEVYNEHVVGIGVGVPSIVDVENGIVYDVQKIPAWREVHLKDILKSKFSVEIYINNDANCFVVGEKYFGKAQNISNIVGLQIGTGLGAGIIIKDKLYSGANCGAGEIGLIPYKDRNYEYYCSSEYFEMKYGMTIDVLLERAKQEDKVARAIFEHFGVELANVLKTILLTYDPEMIVLGGTVSNAYDFFEKSMLENIKSFPYRYVLKRLKIEVSTGNELAVKGAAALYFDANYNAPLFLL